jgi:hypothetical protein
VSDMKKACRAQSHDGRPDIVTGNDVDAKDLRDGPPEYVRESSERDERIVYLISGRYIRVMST